MSKSPHIYFLPRMRDSWLLLLEGITMSRLSLKAFSASSRKPQGHLPDPSWLFLWWTPVIVRYGVAWHWLYAHETSMFAKGRSLLGSVPFNLRSDLAGWSPQGWSDASCHRCGCEVTLTFSFPRRCNSSEAAAASLEGAVHPDRRPISQGGHWSHSQMAWFPCVIISSV